MSLWHSDDGALDQFLSRAIPRNRLLFVGWGCCVLVPRKENLEMENFDKETAVRQFLTQNMWPIGLQNALLQSIQSFPVRFMIVDDSGSMMANDGHIIMQHHGKFMSAHSSSPHFRLFMSNFVHPTHC
jgi:hypothetical protein